MQAMLITNVREAVKLEERRFSSQPLCKVRRQAGDGSKAQHHENLADFERIGKQKIKQTGEEHSCAIP